MSKAKKRKPKKDKTRGKKDNALVAHQPKCLLTCFQNGKVKDLIWDNFGDELKIKNGRVLTIMNYGPQGQENWLC